MSQKRTIYKMTKGFTTIELMIAATLGLLLLGGVLQLFIGSNRNYSMQEQLSTIQENGRFAMMFLEEEIQKAGWSENYTDSPKSLELGMSSDGINGSSDSIAISYKGVAGGVIDNRDCNGAEVASGIIINRYYVDATTNQLMCQGNGGFAAQPYLSNVERFEVLYGVDTDKTCPDGVVNSYMSLNNVVGQGYAGLVYSVRFAVLLKGDKSILDITQKSNGYQVLDQLYIPQEDHMARRLFQQTVFMPNAVFASAASPEAIIDCMSSNI